jgi:hypothetical protein
LGINYTAGIFGYLMFTDAEPYENIFMYLDSGQAEVAVGLIAAYIIAACTLCYYTSYIADLTISLIADNVAGHRVSRLIAVILHIALYMFSSFAGDKFYEMVVALANISSVSLVFILPSAYYLAQMKCMRPTGAAMALVVFAVGLPFGGMLLYTAFIALIEEWPDL